MTDILTKQERSVRMSLIRGTGNETTELIAASLLRELGATGWLRHWKITWEVDVLSPRLRARQQENRFRASVAPDFVFRQRKVALFIDGCFWHCCPKHGHVPLSNKPFWIAKLERNVLRDQFIDAVLPQLGWTVLRLWEHELLEKRTRRWLARHLGV